MLKEMLKESADTEEFEEIIDDIREAFNKIGQLEIFADNYVEIVEGDKGERDELISAIMMLNQAGKNLDDMK